MTGEGKTNSETGGWGGSPAALNLTFLLKVVKSV